MDHHAGIRRAGQGGPLFRGGPGGREPDSLPRSVRLNIDLLSRGPSR